MTTFITAVLLNNFGLLIGLANSKPILTGKSNGTFCLLIYCIWKFPGALVVVLHCS